MKSFKVRATCFPSTTEQSDHVQKKCRKRTVSISLLEVAGQGCFGTVFKCSVTAPKEKKRGEEGVTKAMKVLKASKRSSRRELEALRRIGDENDNLVGLRLFFRAGGEQEEKMLHLVFDYLPGGTLFDELQGRNEGQNALALF